MQALDVPNLRDTPFRLGVGPDEVVEHGPWRAARDGVLARLAAGPAHVALLGPAGSGKTLLLHVLARALQDQGRMVRVGDRGGTLPDVSGDAILLIDDADRLDAGAMVRLAARRSPCVLAGPPALTERLPAPFAAVMLSPLSPDEVARFVAVRLAAAGQRRDLLQPDAVLALARLSGGAPRQVNALAGAAVFLAGLDGTAEVGPHHVEEAAALRDGDAPPPPAVPSAPVEDEAPEPAPPLRSALPLTPRRVTPRRAQRPRWAVVAAGAATASLLLAGAVLVGHSGTAPQPREQTASAARLRPSPAPLPAPQEAAVAKAPAAPPPSPSVPVPPRDGPATPDPATASPWVVVHYRGGALAKADRLAAALTGTDPKFSHVEVREVQDAPRNPTIRFFHPEDVGVAWELEAALSAMGETWQVRNFTQYQRKSRRGTLEVWLP
jgi:energy-coupling factor transporter ATP-binding protein EcfA2